MKSDQTRLKAYFQLLDVAPGANLEEIRAAYRLQMQAWHPDRFGANTQYRFKAEERAKQINEAYNYLKTHWSEYQEETFRSGKPSAAGREGPDEDEVADDDEETDYDEDDEDETYPEPQKWTPRSRQSSPSRPWAPRLAKWSSAASLLFEAGWLVAKLFAGVAFLALVIKAGVFSYSWLSTLRFPDLPPPVETAAAPPSPPPPAEEGSAPASPPPPLPPARTEQIVPGVEPEPLPPPPELPHQTDAAPPSDIIDAAAFIASYDANKKNADQIYKGTTVKLRGIATKVGKGDLFIGSVHCKFPSPGSFPVPPVTKGMAVIIEGAVKGKSFWKGNITLEPCRLTNPGF